jgi:hypothetical protein
MFSDQVASFVSSTSFKSRFTHFSLPEIFTKAVLDFRHRGSGVYFLFAKHGLSTAGRINKLKINDLRLSGYSNEPSADVNGRSGEANEQAGDFNGSFRDVNGRAGEPNESPREINGRFGDFNKAFRGVNERTGDVNECSADLNGSSGETNGIFAESNE